MIRSDNKSTDNQSHPNGIKCTLYMKSIEKILCLDQVSESYFIYRNTGKLWKKVKANPLNHPKGSKIFSIGWSDSEQRIGACIQGKSLSFWDWCDGFEYEHNFYHNANHAYLKIHYVEYCNTWITFDSNNIIHKWDIYKETSIKLPKVHEQAIIEVLEVPTFPALLASSLDKRIVAWDIIKGQPLAIIKLPIVSIHTMVYSNTLEVMFTAGYEFEICVWNFARGYDITLSQKFSGHNSQITAIQVMDIQKILISIDEIGWIKSWDVLTSTCMQSFHFETKISLSKIIPISDNNFIVVGKRLHFFKFDTEGKDNKMVGTNTTVIDMKYSKRKSVFYIATYKDVRLFDGKLGKYIRIYSNIVSEDEEISAIALAMDDTKLIIAGTLGNSYWVSLKDGMVEKTKRINSSVILTHYDEYNELLTVIRKSNINIESYKSSIRELYGKSIELEQAAVCEYLNLIAGLARDGIVYIWNYCTFKLISILNARLNNVSALKFLQSFSFLLVLHDNRVLTLWEIVNTHDSSLIDFKPFISFIIPNVVVTALTVDHSSDSCNIFLGTESGILKLLETKKIVNGLKVVTDIRKTEGYDARRSFKIEFVNKELLNRTLPDFEVRDAKEIRNGVMQVQAYNEAIHIIESMKIHEQEVVGTKGANQIIKLWKVQNFKLIGVINIERGLPLLWDMIVQDSSKLFFKLVRALVWLYKFDKKMFDQAIDIRLEDKFFTTEIEFDNNAEPLLYGALVKKNTKQIERVSFKQLNFEKEILQYRLNMSSSDKEIDYFSLIDLEQSIETKRIEPTRKQQTLSLATPLSPPIFKTDISQYKLIDDDSLPLIKNTSTRNLKQEIKKTKGGMKYEKEKDIVLPLVINASGILRTKHVNTKYKRKILSELLGKETKAKSNNLRTSKVKY